jgi:hypothetical protein
MREVESWDQDMPPLRRSRKARRKQTKAITALFSSRNLDDFPGLVNGIYFYE